MDQGMRPGRAYYYAITGFMLVLAGMGLLVGSMVTGGYSTEESCRSANGMGGSSGGSSGTFARSYPAPPPPADGRCSGRVNDVYYEGPIEDQPALYAAARDEALARTGARPLRWGGIASLITGVVLIARSKRTRDEVAHHPSAEL